MTRTKLALRLQRQAIADYVRRSAKNRLESRLGHCLLRPDRSLLAWLVTGGTSLPMTRDGDSSGYGACQAMHGSNS